MVHKLVSLLLLALPLTAQAAPAHPHLLFGASDVARLQAQAQSTHQSIYTALKGGTDSFLGTRIRANADVAKSNGSVWFNLGDRRDIGDSLVVFSFVYVLSGDPKYLTLATNWLTDVTSWSTLDIDPTGGQDPHDLIQEQILAAVAISYDMLYNQLSASLRSRILQVIQQNANEVVALAKAGAWWSREYLQNHNWINSACPGLAALAVEGELDSTTTASWRQYATANVKAIYNATSGITDGTWHEGFGYVGYGYTWQLPYLLALKRAGYEDLTSFPMLRPLGRTFVHQQISEAPTQTILTAGDFFGFGMDVGTLRFAATYYKDGFAQLAADRYVSGGKRNSYVPEAISEVFEYLYYDPTVPQADLSTEPLDWYGSDLQGVVFRSGWGAGSTVFGMKSGTFGGRSVWSRLKAGDTSVGELNFGHDHPDDNGFYLFGNGGWLAPEAEGYGAGNANFTLFHNSLIVDGQSQLGSGTLTKGDAAQSYSWFSYREGSIPFHGSSTDFAFATGNGAHLYDPSLGLNRWDRHVLFLDRKWIVIRDVVEASASHTYSWFSHFFESASQEGSWIHGRGPNGQSLGVAVIAPASWTFATGKQAPQNVGKLNPNGYVYAATVTPTASQANVSFLTALVPTPEASWSSRPSVNTLDTSAPERGLYFTNGSTTSVALLNRLAADDTHTGGFHLIGQAGVSEYVNGVSHRVLLVKGTLLEGITRRLLQQDGSSAMLEADGLDTQTLALSGDVLKQVTVYAPTATQVTWYGSAVPFTRSGDYVAVQLAAALTAPAWATQR